MIATSRRVQARSQRGTGGFSLVETVIVIALTSFVVTGVAFALLSVVKYDRLTKRQQEMSFALSTFAEALRRLPFNDCVFDEDTMELQYYSDFVSANPDVLTENPKFTFEVKKVLYWQPGMFDGAGAPTPGEFGAACVAGAGVAQLEIAVTDDEGSLGGEVVLRNQEPPT